jgi:hypothetical protein
VKKSLALALLAVTLLAGQAFAVDRRFGVGIIIGEPTGASAKLWGPKNTALQFAVAASFQDATELHLHADFVYHKDDLFDLERGSMPLYYGAGLRVKFFDDDELIGVRFPVGLNYRFEDDPLDAFIEVAPILDVAPDTDFSINAAIGARYYF